MIIAGCRCFTRPLPSGPQKRDTMPNEHQSDRIPEPEVRGPVRGRLILGVALGVLAVASLVVAAITLRNDSSAIASRTEPPAPSMTSPPTSTAGLRTELVARLESILRQREEAYHKRDPKILDEIYTTDCPCLESDSNAIRELLDKEYVWVGGATSILVQRLERVGSPVAYRGYFQLGGPSH
jgi:hypothetical protein